MASLSNVESLILIALCYFFLHLTKEKKSSQTTKEETPTMEPMEPMDTYLCVLLELQLISSPGRYRQFEICGIINSNQESFDQIYSDPIRREQARQTYMRDAHMIDVEDKQSDCSVL